MWNKINVQPMWRGTCNCGEVMDSYSEDNASEFAFEHILALDADDNRPNLNHEVSITQITKVGRNV